MTPLSEVQRAFAAAILSPASPIDELPAFVGRIPSRSVLDLHRNTVLGALTSALRLTFPTVDNLVGADFFERAALEFVAHSPPRDANFSVYGQTFPSFLERFEPVASLPYLADVARFDLAIDQAQRGAASQPQHFTIDVQVRLEIAPGLRLLALNYPADELRALIEEGAEEELGRLDLSPKPYWVAVWRREKTVRTLRLAGSAGRFLAALLDGLSPDDALQAGFYGADPDEALTVIQSEVFAASFTKIISKSELVP